MKKISWGILGAGKIARKFATALKESSCGELWAVASRSQEKADAFGKEFGASKNYGSYEKLLADPMVDAVYICTPHPLHAEWAVKTAEAGKHILCEKPLGLTYAETTVMVEAALEHQVFLAEAFMYRFHPYMEKLADLIQKKVVGDIRLVKAAFGFRGKFDAQSRLWNNELGGGGIMDIGCYPISFASWVAGVISGKSGIKPLQVTGGGKLVETGVDEFASAIIQYPEGLFAEVSTSMGLNLDSSTAYLMGTEGSIQVTHPWVITGNGSSEIRVFKKGVPEPEVIKVSSDKSIYSLEIDGVCASIQKGKLSCETMPWEDTLANMSALDSWRKVVGVTYQQEKIENQNHPVSKRPVKFHKSPKMSYLSFPGNPLPVSQIVIGGMIKDPQSLCFIYDKYFEAGGNAIDTAYIYGKVAESSAGQWIKSRGVRREMFLVGKGAHTPFCDPQNLTTQLIESLGHLQTDYLDLYCLHRDNPKIPVGEFIDVLNEHVKAGRIRAFGTSNWSNERVDAANEYARKNKLTGFSAVSNHFSLARMVRPIWPGTVSSTDPQSLKWLKKRKLPIFAWSSQARGFFTEAGDPSRMDSDMKKAFLSDENLKRRKRTYELAKKYGVQPINIALAYVLQQSFPVFALIGPLELSELRSTLTTLEVKLTPEEIQWLDLESDSSKGRITSPQKRKKSREDVKILSGVL